MGSSLVLKGKGTCFGFIVTGLGGKDAGNDVVGVEVKEMSSSSPSSGDEVASRFEGLLLSGDLDAILLRRLGTIGYPRRGNKELRRLLEVYGGVEEKWVTDVSRAQTIFCGQFRTKTTELPTPSDMSAQRVME